MVRVRSQDVILSVMGHKGLSLELARQTKQKGVPGSGTARARLGGQKT